MSLRDWIRNETSLDDGARKSILQLEVLKRCEGVAYLLLRSPGDVLGVGKPSRRTRRVSSTTTMAGGKYHVNISSLPSIQVPWNSRLSLFQFETNKCSGVLRHFLCPAFLVPFA